MNKSLTFVLIACMLIAVVASTPLAGKADANVPLVAELAVDDAGFQSAGMRGCTGQGGPGGPRPTTTTTTASSG